MSAIVFWSRIIWAILLGVGSIPSFQRGEIATGVTALGTTLVLIWSPALLLYSGKKPSSLASLKHNFDAYTLAAWLRAAVGLLCAMGGFSSLAVKDIQGSVALLLLGWFLLSPFGGKIFSYGQKSPGRSGRRPWGSMQTALFIARSAGLFFIVCGIALYGDPQGGWEVAAGCVIPGLLLVFCRQIKMLVYGKQPSMTSPGYDYATPQDEELFSEEPVQPNSAAGTVSPAPVSPGLPPASDNLAKLSAKYNELQKMEMGKKMVAYREFLNELFSLYDFSAKNVFYIDGDEINGTFEMEGQVYVLSAICGPDKCEHEDLLVFNAKIEAKSTWARGIFISDAGFTQDGLATFAQGKRTSIICMDGSDLRLVLHSGLSLVEAIKRKARRAVETNRSFVPLHDLI